MKITKEWLDLKRACSSGAEWAIEGIGDGMEFSELLPQFDKADWLIWTLGKIGDLNKKQYVEIAILCAKSSLKFFEKEYPKDKRPRMAIRAALDYLKNPTEENRLAAYAADAAYAAYAAADAAAYAAAYAAANAAACAAAYPAVNAADAAARAASLAALAACPAARKEMHKKLCNFIRIKLKQWGKYQ